MLKLAHRIATMKAGTVVGATGQRDRVTEVLLDIARETRQQMNQTPPVCIDLQPVSDYFAGNAKREYDMEEFPCGVVPFDYWLMEYLYPKQFYVPSEGKTVQVADDYWTQLAAVGSTVDVSVGSPSRQRLTEPDQDTIEHQFRRLDRGRWQQAVDRSKFWCTSSFWYSTNHPHCGGRPVFTGVVVGTACDHQGAPIDTIIIHPWNDEEYATLQAMVEHLRTTLLMACSFMSCKNVVMPEYRGPGTAAPTGKAARKAGIPESPIKSFRTVEIEPLKRAVQGQPGGTADGVQRAMHICRGHFAEYTADKPLFGHTVGRVWRPQHVRGTAALGTVEKDYRVNPAGDGPTPSPRSE